MKIITVVGARPQFVKAAVVSRAIEQHNKKNDHPKIEEKIVHTGQHFDKNMSAIFFDQMDIPEPHYNLEINSLSHGAMTGKMLEEIEKVILKENPDWVLVYGDTNSTLAGALAAKKLHIKVAHVEAGLRSFNMAMPEEINRILTDRISDILFCPTETAIDNLAKEGYLNINSKRIQCGDVMNDAAIYYSSSSTKPKSVTGNSSFVLSTIHRQENTDFREKLTSIFEALDNIAENERIIIPLHPRTIGKLKEFNIVPSENIELIEPVGYFEMIWLLSNCTAVITDSGGLQKEAFFFGKPCITVREETEWVELVNNGVNLIAGSNKQSIFEKYNFIKKEKINFNIDLYGTGNTGQIIVSELVKYDNH